MVTQTDAIRGAPATASRRRRRRSVNTVPLIGPSVVVLLLWMVVPLGMTLWFSLQYYNLLYPDRAGFAGIENYEYLLTDPSLWTAMLNTLYLVGWVLVITVVLGTLLAVLFDQEFFGRNVARLLAIAPFFVMPTVSALIWKNMLMHPVNGLFAWINQGALGCRHDRLVRRICRSRRSSSSSPGSGHRSRSSFS